MHNRRMPPITENELRSGLKRWLSSRFSLRSRLFEELGIEGGAARIDLAVVGKDLEAYELKSDFDSFARMHNQIHAYNRVFDRVWIVTGSAHAAAAIAVVPRWWGVLVANRRERCFLEFQKARVAESNPVQDAVSVARLLWRDEALKLLETYGLRAARRATRIQLSEVLSEALDLKTLRECVAQCLWQRRPTISTL